MCTKHFETFLLFNDEAVFSNLIPFHYLSFGFRNLQIFQTICCSIHLLFVATTNNPAPDSVHPKTMQIGRIISEAEKAYLLSVFEQIPRITNRLVLRDVLLSFNDSNIVPSYSHSAGVCLGAVGYTRR